MPITFEFSKEATKRNRKVLQNVEVEDYAEQLHSVWAPGVEKGKRRIK